MINNLSISKVTENDFDEVYEVFKITIPDTFKKAGSVGEEEFIENEVLNKKRMLQHAIKDEKFIFFVARGNNKVIGAISFGECSEDIKTCTKNEMSNLGELGSLFVLPEYQGKGVGSRLINYVVDYLKEQGIKEFCLDSGYEHAQKRWTRKFGNPYIIVKDHWAPGVDNMVWKCSIN